MSSPGQPLRHAVTVDVGAMPIRISTESAGFARMLKDRYGKFMNPLALPVTELEIKLVDEADLIPQGAPPSHDDDGGADLSVHQESGRWVIERDSYRAEWDATTRRGWVRQTANPYAIDGVLRILHSLLLANTGGFMVHAASGVRNGRACLFAGASGAGKTTISSLAPPDVTLLTDEISYVRRAAQTRNAKIETRKSKLGTPPNAGRKPEAMNRMSPTANPESLVPSFEAFGTPFAGELARVGENLRAPVAALYLLAQGPENRVQAVNPGEAARALLRHVLFFARDNGLVHQVFETVLEFVRHVPVHKLQFMPDARVWELVP